MGRLILLALLIGGGHYAYKKFFYKSPAFLAWSQFSDAQREGKCDPLRALAVEKAAAWVQDFCFSGMGGSAASFADDMASTPQGAMTRIMRRVESEKTDADGKEVTLKVVEWLGGPGAAPSPMYKPPPPWTVSAKIRKADGSWKVVEFSK